MTLLLTMYPPSEVRIKQTENCDDSTEDDCYDDVGDGGSGIPWIWDKGRVAGYIVD